MQAVIADLRKDYALQGFSEAEADPDPFRQFQSWFDQALKAQIHEPNAMTLATASPEGIPNARIVLLKGIDDRGFLFYTNYQSCKGQELAENPQAVLVFLWHELERQVRIRGQVELVSVAESDQYFESRPRNSRLGAWVSEQSQVIADRSVLEQRWQSLLAEYPEDQPIPRPDHWGGYRVLPVEIEFWQGRPSRLHDRLRYRLEASGTWKIERLAP